MDELDLIGKAVSIKFSSCTVLSTGDLLVGKENATRHEVLDAMIAHWMNDPVHGTKAGYSKLAMKLAERVEADLVPKAKKTSPKKRAASPEASGSGTSYPRNVRGRGGFEPGYTFSPGSHPNQRGGWLPSCTRGGSRGGGGRGGGGRGGGGRGGGGRGRGRAASYYYWPQCQHIRCTDCRNHLPCIFFLILVCLKKKLLKKNPRPACKHLCCGYK